tara:strand:+ start:833 stop:1885 length:1053 start_codon:yes stop_codon:yes gene_type:complete
MIKNGGYHSYFLVGPPLPVETVRRIYYETNQDFLLGWDLFYLNLTLENKKFLKLNKCILFLYEYARHVYTIVKDPNWVYDISFDKNIETYEVFFRNNTRRDQQPFCGYDGLDIYTSKKSDICNSIKAILPCLTFKEIFRKKMMWHVGKFKNCDLPSEIILEECRSIEYRSLYYFAKKRDVDIKISWRNASTYLYTKDELKDNKNLDMPVPLLRPEFIDNNVTNLKDIITLEDDILIIVPSMFKTEDIVSWVLNAVDVIKANNYYFSIHPSSGHLIEPINKLNLGKIDYEKDRYFNKYKFITGTYSTLIQNASNNGIIIYPLAFDQHELEYMDSMMSNVTIYNALKFKKEH